jgi:hypothetical protein
MQHHAAGVHSSSGAGEPGGAAALAATRAFVPQSTFGSPLSWHGDAATPRVKALLVRGAAGARGAEGAGRFAGSQPLTVRVSVAAAATAAAANAAAAAPPLLHCL